MGSGDPESHPAGLSGQLLAILAPELQPIAQLGQAAGVGVNGKTNRIV